MDVTLETSIRTGLVRVSERGLVLDLLINNAGINVSGVVEEMPRKQGRAIMDTNFYRVVDTIRAVLPHMRNRRRGTILTIGSLAGLVAPPGEAYYAASKHALEGFWSHFSMKWRPLASESVWQSPDSFRSTSHAGQPIFLQPARITITSAPHSSSTGWQRSMMACSSILWPSASSTGRSPGAAFGLDALWAPIAKQLLPESIFSTVARRKFGI